MSFYPPDEYDFKFGPVQDYRAVRFPFNPSAWVADSEQSREGTELAGRLSGLPLDIFWTVLDECLFKWGDLTLQHDAFHSLLSLSQVDPRANQYVEEYVARRNAQFFLRRELGDIEVMPYNEGDNGQDWYPGDKSNFPIKATADFLGRVIQSDCPSCFAYLLDYLEVDIGACNQAGWSFTALAIASRSTRILKYMLAHPGSYHPLQLLLLGPANVNFPRPTSLGLLGQCGDDQFLDEVLNLIEKKLADLKLPGVIAGAFSAEDIFWLCTYITSSQSERLKALGVPITDFADPVSQITAWHGAASNTIEFLEYLRVTSSVSPCEFNNGSISPLCLAVTRDRIDVVRWFKKYGYARIAHEYGKPTELSVAMMQDSGESVLIVQELLTTQPGTYISSLCAGELLHGMASALYLKSAQMQQVLGEGEYAEWGKVSEAIAIEKGITKMHDSLRAQLDLKIWHSASCHSQRSSEGTLFPDQIQVRIIPHH